MRVCGLNVGDFGFKVMSELLVLLCVVTGEAEADAVLVSGGVVWLCDVVCEGEGEGYM